MEDELQEALRGDYTLTIVHGQYFDCPSCDGGVGSFYAKSFYTEADLIDFVIDKASSDQFKDIYLTTWGDGNLVKYSTVKTKTGFHSVSEINFDLPETGKVIIVKSKDGYKIADKSYTVLYGQK